MNRQLDPAVLTGGVTLAVGISVKRYKMVGRAPHQLVLSSAVQSIH